MFTNGEIRRAIEKYQKEHPLHSSMLDVTTISSKEGADIISQTIEQVAKKVDEDTELWCICEMAKMYMQGVKPVYPVRPQGEWKNYNSYFKTCSLCNKTVGFDYIEQNGERFNFCPNCGADMRGKEE